MSESDKKRYWFYVNNRICPQCKRADLAENESKCQVCRAKNAFYSAKYTEAHREKVAQTKRTSLQKTREYRRANHLCVDCGKDISHLKTNYCTECLLKHRRYNEECRLRKKIKMEEESKHES